MHQRGTSLDETPSAVEWFPKPLKRFA